MPMSLRLWDEHVVPRLTDASLRGEEVDELREQVCTGLVGRVLEIGFGSGLNARWYPASVTEVSAVEPSDVGWAMSERRRDDSRATVVRAGLDGQELDLPDDSHDSALVTFSLCTVPDPVCALREVARVVRPGGQLHLAEHGLAPDEGVRRWQRRMEPLQRAMAGGCHLTRDVTDLLSDAGWRPGDLQSRYLPGPGIGRPWTYVSIGTALHG